jgi:hypothetical protein
MAKKSTYMPAGVAVVNAEIPEKAVANLGSAYRTPAALLFQDAVELLVRNPVETLDAGVSSLVSTVVPYPLRLVGVLVVSPTLLLPNRLSPRAITVILADAVVAALAGVSHLVGIRLDESIFASWLPLTALAAHLAIRERIAYNVHVGPFYRRAGHAPGG